MNLRAIYPDGADVEMSFEELRASARGWLDRDWSDEARSDSGRSKPCRNDQPHEQIPAHPKPTSINSDVRINAVEVSPSGGSESTRGLDLGQTVAFNLGQSSRDGRSRKKKTREVRGETQTSKQIVS